MKSYSLKNQHGAVLAFTLMILVVLTLASVSMIRQNKVQITIATNAAQQTVTFAGVETILRQAQSVLELKRYVDANGNGDINDDVDGKTHKHCNSSDTAHAVHLYPHASGILIDQNNSTVTAKVKEEYCISNYADPDGNGPRPSVGNEHRCLYSATGTRNLVIGSEQAEVLADPTATPPVMAMPPIPDAENVAACDKLNKAGGVTANTLWTTGHPNPNACQIEVYTLHVKFIDTTDTERTIESKFEIDCSGDLNMANAP